MAKADEQTFRSDGLRLYARRWRASERVGRPRATVAIVHGWAEHGGRYEHTARYLSERGYEVWAVDLRGHGLAEGPRAYVEDMEELVRDVDQFLSHVRASGAAKPLFLLGHSLGGCTSTLYVLRRAHDLAGLILSGPALQLGKDFSPVKIAATRALGRFVPRLPVEKLSSASISRDPEVVRQYDNDPLNYRGWARAGFGLAFVRAAEEIGRRMNEIKLPLLVLQGGQDRIINRDGGAALHREARSKDKRYVVYEELYHEVLNEPEKEKVLGDVAAWLDERAGEKRAEAR